MKEFEKIIGYDEVKQELCQIADMVRNKEKYDKLGVALPTGIVLHGEPGVGKTLMMTALIRACGLKCYTCRKDKPNGDFVKHIKTIFDKAVKETPSIVFLDDMDKFANGDERRPDCEEYVTVQSCIDEVKNKNVLILATANNIRCLPRSLLRAGRFDRLIEVNSPNDCDSEKIFKHYLKKKKVSAEFDYDVASKLMSNHTCAELETVINEAGIYAGFDNSESIKTCHFLKAVLKNLYGVPVSGLTSSQVSKGADKSIMMTAYHEAGHALVHEVFEPESISLLAVYGSCYHKQGGITIFKNSELTSIEKCKEIRIIAALAGKAAVEYKYGIADMGCSRDVDQAYEEIKHLIDDCCTSSFSLFGGRGMFSDGFTLKQENVIAAELERYYKKAKEIICTNSELFEKLATELAKNRILSSRDIKKIRAELQ